MIPRNLRHSQNMVDYGPWYADDYDPENEG